MENVIESYLVRQVKQHGGMCLKFESPGCNGVPDRMIVMPGGRVYFAELKDTGKRERPRQVYIQSQLRAMGCTVFSSVDSKRSVDSIIEDITA